MTTDEKREQIVQLAHPLLDSAVEFVILMRMPPGASPNTVFLRSLENHNTLLATIAMQIDFQLKTLSDNEMVDLLTADPDTLHLKP